MQAISAALPAGSTTSSMPCSLALMTIGSAPRTGCRLPSRDSSPMSRVRVRSRFSIWWEAISTATAMGRSKAGPSFLTSAGARLTVSRAMGMVKPELTMAAPTRSRLSLMDASGRPMISRDGMPLAAKTSTVTGKPLTPVSP